MQGYSEATRTGLCRQCQNLAKAPKTCGQCGATHRSPFTQSGTLCENCAYPPCGVCGTTPRPRNSKYHSKKMADWVCGKCSDGQTCTNCHRRLPPGNVANSALCLICRKQTTTSDQLSSGHGPSTKNINNYNITSGISSSNSPQPTVVAAFASQEPGAHSNSTRRWQRKAKVASFTDTETSSAQKKRAIRACQSCADAVKLHKTPVTGCCHFCCAAVATLTPDNSSC